MKKQQFNKLYRRLRLITGSNMVGTHGHLSDLVKDYNVSMQFLRKLRDMRDKPKRIIYGKYTSEYQNAQDQAAAWDSYGERKVGA